MGIREALRKLRQEVSRETTTLTCPERSCGEKFVVYGGSEGNPQVEFLSYWWQKGEWDSSRGEPPEDLRRVAEHEHDPSLFVDERGEPWLGTFFAGNLSAYEEPTRDLSEQEQEE